MVFDLTGQSLSGASFTSLKQLEQHIDAYIKPITSKLSPSSGPKKVHQRPFKGRLILSHREMVEMILAHIEREPLPSRGFDHQDRLARADVLADLGGDHGDDTVSRSTQDHLSRRRSSTVTAAAAACTCASAIARPPPGDGRIVTHLSPRHIGTGGWQHVSGLVKQLLRFEALACQRTGPCESGLHVVDAGACLGDGRLQRVDLFAADAGIDVVAVRDCGSGPTRRTDRSGMRIG